MGGAVSGKDDDPDRRTRISRSAERLFADFAYEAVSVRDIADDAGVNSALVRYYFGTKEELYRALFAERYQIIATERLERLSQVSEGIPAREALSAIVRAWVEPVARLACRDDAANFLMVLARDQLRRDEELHSGYRAEIDTMAMRCIDALCAIAPHAARSTVVTGYTWFVTLAANATANRRRAVRLHPDTARDIPDETAFVDLLIGFVEPGLSAMLGLDDTLPRPAN